MEILVAQITAQQKLINASAPGAAALLANLATLKSGLQTTIDHINSTTYNLEIYQKDLGTDMLLVDWPRYVLDYQIIFGVKPE